MRLNPDPALACVPSPSSCSPSARSAREEAETSPAPPSWPVPATWDGGQTTPNAPGCDNGGDITRAEVWEQQRDLNVIRATLLSEMAVSRQKGDHGRARRLGRSVQDVQAELSKLKAWLRLDALKRQETRTEGGVA